MSTTDNKAYVIVHDQTIHNPNGADWTQDTVATHHGIFLNKDKANQTAKKLNDIERAIYDKQLNDFNTKEDERLAREKRRLDDLLAAGRDLSLMQRPDTTRRNFRTFEGTNYRAVPVDLHA